MKPRPLYRTGAGPTIPDRFEAAFSLALLAVEAGDWDAADRCAAPLLRQHPDLPNLRWLSARVALGRSHFSRRPRALLAGLARTTRAWARNSEPDTRLLLGEACDRLGRTGEAFEAAASAPGKAILRRLYAERAGGREGAVARFKRLAAWFETTDPAPWRTAPAATPVAGQASSHVFLVGSPRSGTTLLEQALAGHPQVATLEEAPTLAAAHAEFMGSAAGLQRMAGITADEAAAWRARYWSEGFAGAGVAAEGRVFVDKAPAGTGRPAAGEE